MIRRSLSPGRCLVVLLGAALLVLAQWLPRHGQDSPLRVAIGMWTGSESLLLARERGMLPDSRFQWMEVTWPSALSSTLDNGVVDAAVMSLESVVTLLENDEDLRVICVLDESKGADAVIARNNIHSMNDLKGRRVGVDLRGPGQHLLAEILASTEMKMADIEMVSILQPEMVDVLARGDVAAVVVSEPWMTRIVADGAHVLKDSTSVQTPIYRVLVVKTPALKAHRQDLKELLRAHFAMMPALRAAQTCAGMDAVLRRQELQPDELADIISRVHHLSIEDNLALMKQQGKGISKAITELMRLSRRERTQREVAMPGLWLDSSLLEELSL
ncbi:MAG: ABC transporter substrate-binding protein [Verrucomicrobiota bacterium]